VRLELERVSRTERVRDLLPKALPADIKPDDVAILNQSNLNDEITPGQFIKLPRARY
jgi:hypothetical protein